MDCSLPGSSVFGVLQARILQCVAMPTSRGIFLTQGLNLYLCGSCIADDSLPLSHPGNPHIRMLSPIWQTSPWFRAHRPLASGQQTAERYTEPQAFLPPPLSDPSPVDGATYKDPSQHMYLVRAWAPRAQNRSDIAGSGSCSHSGGGFWCFNRGTHIPSLSQGMLQACSTNTGREAGWPTSPPSSKPGMLLAALMRFPGAPPITGFLDQKVSTWTFQNILQGLVLASGPHRHPLMGATHQATLHSCLASSGILCTFFKPH